MSLNCEEIELMINNIIINSIITSISLDIHENIIISLKNLEFDQNLLIVTKDSYSGLFIIPQKEKIIIQKQKNRFVDFLNSKIKYGRLLKITQPNKSRIVKLEIKIIDKIYFLYFRLWGVSSNILLTDQDNMILELLKRYPKRNEWPEKTFIISENRLDKKFEIRTFENNSNGIYDFYYNYIERISNDKIEKIRKQLLKELEFQRDKIESNIEKSKDFIENNKDFDKYKQFGELIIQNKNRIDLTKGTVFLVNYDGLGYDIELDRKKSLQDNANFYFEKYKTIKQSILDYTEKLEELKSKFKKILIKIDRVIEINNYQELIDEFQNIRSKTQVIKKGSSLPARKIFLSNDYICYITRSSKDFGALMKYCNGNDYWFHIRDNSGSHVVVKNKKEKSLPDKVRLEASMLALHYSKSKNEIIGDIYFTQIKYLHKPNKKVEGLVIPTQEKNIRVKKDVKIIEKLLQTIE